MYIIYFITTYGAGRCTVDREPWDYIHKSESFWMVPGTVDPEE